MTEQNQKIASNLKAVSDRMVDRQLDQQYRLLYSARPAAAEPQSKKSWIGLMKLLAQSGTIFIDDHAPVLDWLNHQATVAGDMKDVLHRSPATDNISTELLAQKISHRFFRKYGELMMSKYCQQECPVLMSIWMSSIGMKK